MAVYVNAKNVTCLLVIYCFILVITIFFTTRNVDLQNRLTLTDHTHSSLSSRNVLIVMAIDCQYDLNLLINTFPSNPLTTNIYWFFNIYNKPKCGNSSSNLGKNVRTISQRISKMRFWIDYIVPQNTTTTYNVLFDYVWFVDDDMFLSHFHFEEFIHISSHLSASISQPSFRSMNDGKLNTYFSVAYDTDNEYPNVIAKQTKVIEIGAPLFTWNTWLAVYPWLQRAFRIKRHCDNTDWGPNYWWCAAAKQLTNGSCLIIHYTPLIHMNTHTMNKDGVHERGSKCLRYQHKLYPQWFQSQNKKVINDVVKLYYADALLANDHNSDVIKAGISKKRK
eukprot:123121_1